MPALTRAQTVHRKVFKKKKVPMPEWPGKNPYVWARTLSADALCELQEVTQALEDSDAESCRAMAGMCTLGLCDDKGERLYTKDDIPALQEWPLAALTRCTQAVNEINAELMEAAEVKRKKGLRRRKSSSRLGSRSS